MIAVVDRPSDVPANTFRYTKIRELLDLFSCRATSWVSEDEAWEYVVRAAVDVYQRLVDDVVRSDIQISYYIASVANYLFCKDKIEKINAQGNIAVSCEVSLQLASALAKAYEEVLGAALKERRFM